jgi:hypothetical protein
MSVATDGVEDEPLIEEPPTAKVVDLEADVIAEMNRKQLASNKAAAPGVDGGSDPLAELEASIHAEFREKQEVHAATNALLSTGPPVDPDDFADQRKIAIDYGYLPYIPEDPAARAIMSKRATDDSTSLWLNDPVNKPVADWMSASSHNALLTNDIRADLSSFVNVTQKHAGTSFARSTLNDRDRGSVIGSSTPERSKSLVEFDAGQHRKNMSIAARQFVSGLSAGAESIFNLATDYSVNGTRLGPLWGLALSIGDDAQELVLGGESPGDAARNVALRWKIAVLDNDESRIWNDIKVATFGGASVDPSAQARLSEIAGEREKLQDEVDALGTTPSVASNIGDVAGVAPLMLDAAGSSAKFAGISYSMVTAAQGLSLIAGFSPQGRTLKVANFVGKHATKAAATYGGATQYWDVSSGGAFKSGIDDPRTAPTKQFPANHPVRLIHANSVAAIEAFMEIVSDKVGLSKSGLSRLVGTAQVRSQMKTLLLEFRNDPGALKRMAHSPLGEVIQGAGVEAATEVSQTLSALILDALMRRFVDGKDISTSIDEVFNAKTFEEMVTSARVGGVTSLLIGGTAKVATELLDNVADINPPKGTDARTYLEQLNESTGGVASLSKRDPDVARAFVNDTNEAAISPMISAESLDILFQNGDVDHREFFSAVGIKDPDKALEQLRSDLDAAPGIDVVIDLGLYATAISGTPLEAKLMPHMRIAEKQASEAELQEARELSAKSADDVIARIEAEAEEFQTKDDQANAIAEEVFAELQQAAPHLSSSINRVGSQLFGRMIVNIAERENISPEVLAEKVGRIIVTGFKDQAVAGEQQSAQSPEQAALRQELADATSELESLQAQETGGTAPEAAAEGAPVVPSVEPTALQAFPEMNEVDGGGYSINGFSPREQASLRAAGLVSVNSEGHTVVSEEGLWEAREALQALPRAEREQSLEESQARAFEPFEEAAPAEGAVVGNWEELPRGADNWEQLPDGRLVGYRVSRSVDGRAVSGADARQSSAMEPGAQVEFEGDGVFVTNDLEYAKTHYGVHDENAVQRVSFSRDDVTSGRLADAEPEISVRSGEVIGSDVFTDPDLAPTPRAAALTAAQERVQTLTAQLDELSDPNVFHQPASFEPRTETPQEGFSAIPIGRIETEFRDLVDSVGVDDLTAETLAGVTGSPRPRGVKKGNDARKFLANLPKERKKLNAKLKAAKSDAEKKRIQKKLDDLKVKAKKKKVDLAREEDLSSLDSRVKPRSFAELSEFIEIAMGEAGDQSDWYKQFGEGIRGLVGRANLQEASIVFGITSAQNSTRQNLKDTLRIMIIARQHNPLSDPAAFKRAIMKRPEGKGISISSAEVDNIIRMYQSGTYKGGLKVSNYMNLIRDRADNVFSPYTVQDVHMARVMGFLFRNEKTSDKTGITTIVDGAQMPNADSIRYSMFMTELLANKFGIKPDAVQALLWFYAKNHLSPKLPNERALTNLETLYVERQRELNPTPAEDVEGSIEEAMAFSSEEIAELTGLKQNGAFDTEEPLSQALSDGERPHFRSDKQIDPYSNIDLDPDLLDLAQARAPRSTVSANPGQARGYGLPQDTPLSVLQDHERRIVEAITDEDGQVTILRAMGIVHQVGHTLGTWDRIEPSMVFTLPGETIETADFVARLLGDALLQDAAITSQPSWDGQEFAVSFSRKDGSSLTEQEVSDLYEALNPEHSTDGLNFTVSPDGTSLDFRDGRYFDSESYSEEHLAEFLAKISGVLGDSFTATQFGEKGNYHGAEDYTGESGRDSGEVWDRHGLAGRPDLQEIAQRSLYEPAWQVYRDTVAQLGIQPERTEGPLGQPLEQPTTLFQPAFHGTPHRFDKFTLDHIGEGEGAQAFGWGLYFADRRGVANFYREELSSQRRGADTGIEISINGKTVNDKSLIGLGDALSADELQEKLGITRPIQARALENFLEAFSIDGMSSSVTSVLNTWRDQLGILREDLEGDRDLQFDIDEIQSDIWMIEELVAEGLTIEPAGGIFITAPNGASMSFDPDMTITEAVETFGLDNTQASALEDAMFEADTPRSEIGSLQDVLVAWEASFAADPDEHLGDIAALKKLIASGFKLTVSPAGKGQLFEVNIPETEELLDWDLPLSEHSEEVQAKVRSIPEIAGDNLTLQERLERLSTEEIAAILQNNDRNGDYFLVNEDGSPSDFAEHLADEFDEDGVPIITDATRVKWREALIETATDPDQNDGDSLNQYLGAENLLEGFDPNGRTIYQALQARLGGNDKRASNALLVAGLPGLVYDAGRFSGGIAGGKNFVIWDEEAIDVLNTFFQPDGGASAPPRGFIQPGAAGEPSIIGLGEGANASTFFHEGLGHYVEKVLRVLASDPNVSDQLKADYAGLLAYAGVEEGGLLVDPAELQPALADRAAALASGDKVALRNAEKAIDHANRKAEKLARAMEQYVATGEAPSEGLRGAFQRAAKWLRKLYTDLDELTGGQLPDDLVGIFDRVFASDDEIEVAKRKSGLKPAFGSKPEGVSESDWADHQTRTEERQAAYLESLLKKKARIERANQKAILAEDREQLIQLIAEELRKDPIHRARQWLANGQWIDPDEAEPMPEYRKLNAARIEEEFGPAALRALPKHRNGVVGGKRADTWDHIDVARAFGISPEDLINGLSITPTFDDAVNQRVDRAIAEKTADLGDPEQNALDAVHEVEASANFIVNEIRLARKWAKALRAPAAVRKQVAEEGALTPAERNAEVESAQADVEAAQELLEEAAESSDADAVTAAQQEVTSATAALQAAMQRRETANTARPAEDKARREGKQAVEGVKRAERGKSRAFRIAAATLKISQRDTRIAAEEYVRRIPLSQLRPGRFSTQEKRAADRAGRAYLNRDPQALEDAKFDQLFNHFAYRAAKEAQRKMDKVTALSKRKMKPKPLKKILRGNKEIHDHLVAMITGLKLINKKAVPRTATEPMSAAELASEQFAARNDARIIGANVIVTPSTTLADLVVALTEEGHEIAFDHTAVSEAITVGDYKLLSIDELSEVGRAIAQLAHIAGGDLKIKLGGIDLFVDALKEELITTAEQRHQSERRPDGTVPHKDETIKGRLMRFKSLSWAWSKKTSTMAWYMDGGVANGPWQRLLVQAVNETTLQENQMKQDFSDDLAEAFEAAGFSNKTAAGRAEMRKFGDKLIPIPAIGRALTQEQILAVILQLGNKHNRDAMQAGWANYKWSHGKLTDAQLDAILSLPEAEKLVDLAVGIGAMLQRRQTIVFDVNERATQIRPEAVVPQPFTLPSGRVVPGFYYPLARDPEVRLGVKEQVETQDLKDQYQVHRGGPMTSHGHTMGRKVFGDKNAVFLSLLPLYEAMNQIAHDTAQREYVIATRKILYSEKIEGVFRDLNREDELVALKEWLKNLAGSSTTVQSPTVRVARQVRQNESVSILGGSMTTLAMQPSAIFDMMSRVGPANMSRAAWEFMGNFNETVSFAFEFGTALPFRANAWNREIAQKASQLKPDARLDNWNAWLMQWVAKMDLLPTVWSWQAAYIQAFNDIEETRGNESLSAAYADRLTEITQSANQVKDLSRVMAQKDEMTQWLTWFGGFLNSRLNSMWELNREVYEFHRVSQLSYLNRMMFLFVVTPSLVALSRGREPDDDPEDEWWVNWGKFVGVNTVSEVSGLLPVAGPVLSSVIVGRRGGNHPALEEAERMVAAIAKFPEMLDPRGKTIIEQFDPAIDLLLGAASLKGVGGVIQIRREIGVWNKYLRGEYNLDEWEQLPDFVKDVLFGTHRVKKGQGK